MEQSDCVVVCECSYLVDLDHRGHPAGIIDRECKTIMHSCEFYWLSLWPFLPLLPGVRTYQVVDVGCPTVEREYGKHLHNYIRLCMYVQYDKCYGYAHNKNLLRNRQNVIEFSHCHAVYKSMWYVLRTVLPGDPGCLTGPVNVCVGRPHSMRRK